MEKFADYFVYFVIIVVALALRYLYKENRKSKEKENPEEQQQPQQQLYSGPSIRDYANIMCNNTADASDPDTNQDSAANSEQNSSSEQTEVDHRD